MFSNQLLHPNHIVSTTELLSTLMEMSDLCIAKSLMEADTILRQVFIFWLNERDAGIHVEDSMGFPFLKDTGIVTSLIIISVFIHEVRNIIEIQNSLSPHINPLRAHGD